MTYRLVFTETFEKDLDSILDYITNKLFNPTAAAAFYKNVKTTFGNISDHPEMYLIRWNDWATRAIDSAVSEIILLSTRKTANGASFMQGPLSMAPWTWIIRLNDPASTRKAGTPRGAAGHKERRKKKE